MKVWYKPWSVNCFGVEFFFNGASSTKSITEVLELADRPVNFFSTVD